MVRSAMKPDQALGLIDQVISRIQGTREDHDRMKQAISVLAQAIQPKDNGETKQTGKPRKGGGDVSDATRPS